MASGDDAKVFEDSNYRKKMYSPLKAVGFVPEKQSELFVTGVPTDSSINDLLLFFEQVGEVFEIKLMTKPDGVRNRGFAYVTFMNKQLAKLAMFKLKEKLFQNRVKLTMQLSVDNCRIFVNGIPVTKTKNEVWNVLRNDYGIHNIVDVITYRSYANPTHNRGFFFLEFRTHEDASYFRAKYWDKLYLFGRKVSVNWAIPIKEMDENEADKVKILFLRNLNVTEPSEEFASVIYQLIDRTAVEKVYKFKDYAYVHLNTRPNAEKLLKQLQSFYDGTVVEATFAKPPNRFTERCYREQTLASRRSPNVRSSRKRSNARLHRQKNSAANAMAAPQTTFPPIGHFSLAPAASSLWGYPAASGFRLKPDIVPGPSHDGLFNQWRATPPAPAAPVYSVPTAYHDCFNLEGMIDSLLS